MVELETGAVVGYKALARAPHGVFERPDVLFAAARRERRLAEIDGFFATQRSPVLEPSARADHRRFVNTEPAAAIDACRSAATPATSDEGGDDGEQPLFFERTERVRTADPMQLLSLVVQIRVRGHGVQCSASSRSIQVNVR